jgi:hypothetical protein
VSAWVYDPGGLRLGADQHADTQAACAALGDVLAGIGLSAAIFGGVPAAAGFHAAAAGVRAGQLRDVAAEASRRGELAGRAGRAATDGERLTDDTAAVARSVPAPASPAGADPR